MTTDPIHQEPLEQPEKRIAPDPNTDFGNEAFDNSSMPQKKFSTGGISEFIFGRMRPKRKGIVQKEIIRPRIDPHGQKWNNVAGSLANESLGIPLPIEYPLPAVEIPKGFEVQNGTLFRKKSLAETVRDQIRFPAIKNVNSVINGAALVVFAVGAYILYSELPTRPELVIGILLVIIAGTVIANNR